MIKVMHFSSVTRVTETGEERKVANTRVAEDSSVASEGLLIGVFAMARVTMELEN